MAAHKKDGNSKFWATVVALGAGALAVLLGSLLVKVAVIALFVLIVALVGAARAHDMTVWEVAGLYGGKAITWLVKVIALVLVTLPLRGLHRLWVRFEIPLRVELAAHRAAAATWPRLVAAVTWFSPRRIGATPARLAPATGSGESTDRALSA